MATVISSTREKASSQILSSVIILTWLHLLWTVCLTGMNCWEVKILGILSIKFITLWPSTSQKSCPKGSIWNSQTESSRTFTKYIISTISMIMIIIDPLPKPYSWIYSINHLWNTSTSCCLTTCKKSTARLFLTSTSTGKSIAIIYWPGTRKSVTPSLKKITGSFPMSVCSSLH